MQNQGLPQDMAAMMGMICVIVGFAVGVALIVMVFYLLTLQKALSRVSPRNRLMEPAMVWLAIIPLFSLIWSFFLNTRVPDSLRNEFRERGQDDGSDYGKGIGLTMAILNVVYAVVSVGMNAAASAPRVGTCVSGVIGLVGLVLLIVFWVKIANYSRQLAAHSGVPRDLQRRLDEFDDDDDYGGGGVPRSEAPKPPPDTYKEHDPGRYQ